MDNKVVLLKQSQITLEVMREQVKRIEKRTMNTKKKTLY